MPGIAPKLPLQTSPVDGYALTKTLKETMKQNFKMLVMTAPGERMMDPEYGVGLRNYLFDQSITTTRSSLSSAIENQVQTYMPFLRIGNISFPESENPNMLNVKIQYSIPNIGAQDVLDLNVSAGY
jgi:phage baseplate assembly protein W